jgi:GTP-binding protein HflX
VSDTVGFIRDLPKGLLTAFRATLEEVQEAALILQVSDVSNPHQAELDEEVDKILNDLGVADRPRLRIFNKVDRLTQEQRAPLIHPYAMGAGTNGGPVLVSALTGEGIEELLRRMDAVFPVDPVVMLCSVAARRRPHTLRSFARSAACCIPRLRIPTCCSTPRFPMSIARRLKLNAFSVDGTSSRVRA